jgi:predicted SAM-dependent methyltransferase
MRLHIGGKDAKAGWEIFNIAAGPGVDHVGDCGDLSRFADGSVGDIYASHVLEHLSYIGELPRALKEWYRVLARGGRALISVPDFELLCQLFVDPSRDARARYHLMRMVFGGQTEPHDFHHVGLTQEFLAEFLRGAGFARVEQVERFGLFEDSSEQEFEGTLISLNVIAHK